jgi:hypothetical protein
VPLRYIFSGMTVYLVDNLDILGSYLVVSVSGMRTIYFLIALFVNELAII